MGGNGSLPDIVLADPIHERAWVVRVAPPACATFININTHGQVNPGTFPNLAMWWNPSSHLMDQWGAWMRKDGANAYLSNFSRGLVERWYGDKPYLLPSQITNGSEISPYIDRGTSYIWETDDEYTVPVGDDLSGDFENDVGRVLAMGLTPPEAVREDREEAAAALYKSGKAYRRPNVRVGDLDAQGQANQIFVGLMSSPWLDIGSRVMFCMPATFTSRTFAKISQAVHALCSTELSIL